MEARVDFQQTSVYKSEFPWYISAFHFKNWQSRINVSFQT